MPAKRKRAATIKCGTRSVKKAKSSPAKFPLLSLPPEILDEILSYVLYFGNRNVYGRYPLTVTAKWPSVVGLLAACRELRQRGLALLANRCMWILITANTREETFRLRDLEALGFTSVPPIFRRLLPDQLPLTIEICFGNAKTRPRTRSFSNAGTQMLLPYNYANLLAIIRGMDDPDDPIPNVTVRLPSCLSYSRRRMVELEVLPPWQFLTETEICHFRVESRDLPEIAQQYSNIGQGDSRMNIRDLLQSVRLMAEIADNLEAKGCNEEAAFWLCHCGWILDRLPTWLIPSPLQWAEGEQDPDSMDKWGYPARNSGCNAIGNEARTLVHRLEHRAVLGFWSLSQKLGKMFVVKHHKDLADDGDRWCEEGFYCWFGLSDEERAEVHYAKALFKHIQVKAFSPCNMNYDEFLSPFSRNINDLVQVKGGTDQDLRDHWAVESDEEFEYVDDRPGFQLHYPADVHKESLEEIEYALALNPDNKEFEAFRTLLINYPPALLGAPSSGWRESMDDYVWQMNTSHNLEKPRYPADPTRSDYWIGDRSMLAEWGGHTVMRLFPLTQKRIEENKDVEGEISEPVV